MLCLIPARGGSKELPGKNCKILRGKPLIAYTKRAKSLSRVIVTTDSREIAEIAREYGAETPFLRPAHLAKDNSMAMDAYIHAIEFLEKEEGIQTEKFVVLLPTAPLRDEKDIDEAVEIFKKQRADALVSVKVADIPPSLYFRMNAMGRIFNGGFGSAKPVDNRQMEETFYIPNGAIYILDYRWLKEKRTYYSDNTIPYIMPKEKSVDVDDAIDFSFVEFLMEGHGEKVDERANE